MKKLLFVIMCALAGEAWASTDVNLVISSVTHSGVRISTGATSVRVDNLVHGSTITIPSSRIGIELQNQDSADDVYCAYETDFTTATTTQGLGEDIGKQISSDDVVFIGLLRQAQYNCRAVDAAGTGGVWIHVEQVHKE